VNDMNNTKAFMQNGRYKTATAVLASIATVAFAFVLIMNLIRIISIIEYYDEIFSIMMLITYLLESFLEVAAFALFSAFVWFIYDIRRSKAVTVSFTFLAISSLVSAGKVLIMILFYHDVYGVYNLSDMVFSLILCIAYGVLTIYFPRMKSSKMIKNSCAIVIVAFNVFKFAVLLSSSFTFLEFIYSLLYLLFPISVLIFIINFTGDPILLKKAVRRNAEENGSLVNDIESQLLYLKSLHEAGQIDDKDYEYRRRDLLDRL
jgi:hypothetical protein